MKLKLEEIAEEKPIKIALEMPAHIHRDLMLYADALRVQGNSKQIDISKLISPMLERFMASDRDFARLKSRNCKQV